MSDFRMPSLGADMEKGTVVEWLKKPGDRIARGDVVAVVETQKGAFEIEVFEDGVLLEILAPVGTEAPVGAVLARVDAGEAKAAPAAAPPPRRRACPQTGRQAGRRSAARLDRPFHRPASVCAYRRPRRGALPSWASIRAA